MRQIEKELKHYEQLQHHKFKSDFQNRSSPANTFTPPPENTLNTRSLQEMAKNKIISSGIDFSKLPEKMKKDLQNHYDAYAYMLERSHSHIDSMPFSSAGLEELAAGLHRRPNIEPHQKLAEKFAIQYKTELDTIRSPRDIELRSRREELINRYFQ